MTTKIIDYHNPAEALPDFCASIFGADADKLDGRPVLPAQLPAEYQQLLAHHEHMTLRLRAYHDQPIELHVLRDELHRDQYQRRITLTLKGTSHVVELGLVRIHLEYTSPAVRAEILAKKAPLGDILIRANVLRRIEPRWYYRFAPSARLMEIFARPIAHDLFGRLGTIYCDEQPAIELLEIVSSQKRQEQQ